MHCGIFSLPEPSPVPSEASLENGPFQERTTGAGQRSMTGRARGSYGVGSFPRSRWTLIRLLLVVFLTSYQVNNAPCGHDNRLKNKRVAHFRISVALLLTRWLLVLSLELRIPLSSDNWIDLISPSDLQHPPLCIVRPPPYLLGNLHLSPA